MIIAIINKFHSLDGLVGNTPTPRAGPKRRMDHTNNTPTAKVARIGPQTTPHTTTPTRNDSVQAVSFAGRPNAGQTMESLNADLQFDETDLSRIYSEPRVKLRANTDMTKFPYRHMFMKLTDASLILDKRIDEFVKLLQKHHDIPISAFGNPAARSTSEIVAVGRIASDLESGINSASLVLETSRKTGAGLRIPLVIEHNNYDLYPGKIVGLRGMNSSGESFRVSEILTIPLLALPATKIDEVDLCNTRLSGGNSDISDSTIAPLNVIIGSGPYTTETDLSYITLETLLTRASDTKADVLILNGPFLDVDHPLVASGDVGLPETYPAQPDCVTLTDVFKALIAAPITAFAARSPNTTIIMIPSVRDVIMKHTSWPQDKFSRRELGLPKQAVCVTNPVTISINEIVVGISSQDILYEMQQQLVSQGNKGIGTDLLARLTSDIIHQRHFFPVYPPLDPGKLPKAAILSDELGGRNATGANLDVAFLELGEWLHVRPDLLILPSVLTPFAKVVHSVVAINPGTLSKRKGPGTFVEMKIQPRKLTEEERGRELVSHELYNRARVDVIRI